MVKSVSANSTEKVVQATSAGVSRTIRSTTCESQTTSAGGVLSCSSALRNSVSLTTSARQSWSSASRIACTCGRISRPFGACTSTGTIITTVSPGLTRSPSSGGAWMKSSGQAASSASFSSGSTRSRSVAPPVEETHRGSKPHFSFSIARNSGAGGCSSILLTTGIRLTLRSRAAASIFSSGTPQTPAPVTSSSTSARLNARSLRSTRRPPRAVSSSTPAVSRKSTGPSGRSSIGFSTTSVVVPGTGEVIATSWPAIRFRKLDLPELVRPATAICKRMERGALSISKLSSDWAVSSKKDRKAAYLPLRGPRFQIKYHRKRRK